MISGEVIAALIGVAALQLATCFALWMKVEHRLTVLETRLNDRADCRACQNYRKNGQGV